MATLIIDTLGQGIGDFPIVKASDIAGGVWVADTVADRDAIPANRVVIGTSCFVLGPAHHFYRCTGIGPVVWTEDTTFFSSGGGGFTAGLDLAGTSTSQRVIKLSGEDGDPDTWPYGRVELQVGTHIDFPNRAFPNPPYTDPCLNGYLRFPSYTGQPIIGARSPNGTTDVRLLDLNSSRLDLGGTFAISYEDCAWGMYLRSHNFELQTYPSGSGGSTGDIWMHTGGGANGTGNILIETGGGSGSNSVGDLTLRGGNSIGYEGGQTALRSGNSGGTSNGPTLTISTGIAVGPYTRGGNLIVYTGEAPIQGGNMTFTTGNGGAHSNYQSAGGDLTYTTGNGLALTPSDNWTGYTSRGGNIETNTGFGSDISGTHLCSSAISQGGQIIVSLGNGGNVNTNSISRPVSQGGFYRFTCGSGGESNGTNVSELGGNSYGGNYEIFLGGSNTAGISGIGVSLSQSGNFIVEGSVSGSALGLNCQTRASEFRFSGGGAGNAGDATTTTATVTGSVFTISFSDSGAAIGISATSTGGSYLQQQGSAGTAGDPTITTTANSIGGGSQVTMGNGNIAYAVDTLGSSATSSGGSFQFQSGDANSVAGGATRVSNGGPWTIVLGNGGDITVGDVLTSATSTGGGFFVTTGNGGTVTPTTSTTSSSYGGNVTFILGAAGLATGTSHVSKGGTFRVTTGSDGGVANSSSGDFIILTGPSVTTSGLVSLTTGSISGDTGAVVSGGIFLTTGDSTASSSGVTGNIELVTGNGGSSGASGHVLIKSGAASAQGYIALCCDSNSYTTYTAGNIYLEPDSSGKAFVRSNEIFTTASGQFSQLDAAGTLTGTEMVVLELASGPQDKVRTTTQAIANLGGGGGGGSGLGAVTVTAISATVTTSNTVVSVRGQTTGITITLPAAPTTAQVVTIKDTTGVAATYSITIAGNGKTIDGQASYVISTNYESVMLCYDGTS